MKGNIIIPENPNTIAETLKKARAGDIIFCDVPAWEASKDLLTKNRDKMGTQTFHLQMSGQNSTEITCVTEDE